MSMRIALLLGWVLWLAVSSFAGDICPEKVQSVLLVKVLSYTREISGAPKGEVSLGVLNGGPMLDFLKGAVASSTDKINVKSVGLDNLAGINVLYIPKGTSSDQVTQAKTKCKSQKIMSVGGDPNYVVAYNLTLTFQLVEGKPRMLVCIESADEEGAKFAAEFLKIAEKK